MSEKTTKPEAKPDNVWMMSAFAVAASKGETLRVDRKAGIIYGVAAVTEGEAKGHGVSLDSEFVGNVTELAAQKQMGLKMRFGHPNMSSTALGTFIGRGKNFRTEKAADGSAVTRFDAHLDEVAQETPNGNLFDYVLNMAEKNPDMLGTSIVFTPGKLYKRGADGAKLYEPRFDENVTPAERKKQRAEWDAAGKKVFTEVAALHAADIVDDPAANKDGLFSGCFDTQTWAAQVTEFLDTHPDIFQFIAGKPEIIPAFLERYNSYRERSGQTKLSIAETPVGQAGTEKEPHMAAEENKGGQATPPATPPKVELTGDQVKQDIAKFTKAFGVEKGLAWYQEGKTFEQAQSEFITSLQKDVADKDKQLSDIQKVGHPALSAKPAVDGKLAKGAEKKTSLAACVRLADKMQHATAN